MQLTQAPGPFLANVTRSWRQPDRIDGGIEHRRETLELFGGNVVGRADARDEAIRIGHDLALADLTRRPIFGVIQARQGFELVELHVRYGGAATGTIATYTDAPTPFELPHSRSETLHDVQPSLVAIVGVSAWRDAASNQLHAFGNASPLAS